MLSHGSARKELVSGRGGVIPVGILIASAAIVTAASPRIDGHLHRSPSGISLERGPLQLLSIIAELGLLGQVSPRVELQAVPNYSLRWGIRANDIRGAIDSAVFDGFQDFAGTRVPE
jgi:hypothetical protein